MISFRETFIHLNQAQGTFFTVNLLKTLLNDDIFTTFEQQILDGDPNFQNLNLSKVQNHSSIN